MGFLSGLISKLTGGAPIKAAAVAMPAHNLSTPPSPVNPPGPLATRIVTTTPSLPTQRIESAKNGSSTNPLPLEADAEIVAKLQAFSYVTDGELSQVPLSKQWWGIQSQVSESNRWLQPFVEPAIAALNEFKNTRAAGVLKADRVAITLRGLIRPLLKAKEPHEDLLRALYGACLMRDLVHSLVVEGLTLPATEDMTEFVHLDELRTVDCNYSTVGYQHVASLGKTDIKWLVHAFGEPTDHKTVDGVFQLVRKRAIARYCWKELNRSALAPDLQRDKHVAMREWLTAQMKAFAEQQKNTEMVVAKLNSAAAKLELLKADVSKAITVPFIVVDLETTGLNTQTDSILELVAVRADPSGEVLDEFGALVKVSQRIPVYVSELKSISKRDIERHGRPLVDVLTEFHAFVGFAPLFFQSGLFGAGFLMKAASEIGIQFSNPIHDTLFMPTVHERPGHPKEATYNALTSARGLLEALVKSRAEVRKEHHTTMAVTPAQSRNLHWPQKGLFPISVVGEDYRREALAGLVRNLPGKPALAFCTATLVPDDTNAYDSSAIKVVIEGQHVGYLSKEYAPVFRSYFRKFNLPIQSTTCDAVIYKGLVVEGKTYGYAVELDLLPELGQPDGREPTHQNMLRMSTDPIFVRQLDGSYFVETWLSSEAFEDIDDRANVDTWTTDHWTDINYYLSNKFGVGLGHKLFGVPKETHKRLFGNSDPDVRIEVVKGRVMLLSLNPCT